MRKIGKFEDFWGNHYKDSKNYYIKNEFFLLDI